MSAVHLDQLIVNPLSAVSSHWWRDFSKSLEISVILEV